MNRIVFILIILCIFGTYGFSERLSLPNYLSWNFTPDDTSRDYPNYKKGFDGTYTYFRYTVVQDFMTQEDTILWFQNSKFIQIEMKAMVPRSIDIYHSIIAICKEVKRNKADYGRSAIRIMVYEKDTGSSGYITIFKMEDPETFWDVIFTEIGRRTKQIKMKIFSKHNKYVSPTDIRASEKDLENNSWKLDTSLSTP